MVTIEDNLISEWKSFDQLNMFKNITHIRCGGNPILEKAGIMGRSIVISRVQFLKSVNGSEIEPGERRDAELHYLKRTYEDYVQGKKLEQRVELTDETLMTYMNEVNPRWYELVETYGSPLDMISLKKEGTNIASTSAKLFLAGPGKILAKKLLLSMTVKDLKSMCGKLFKIEALKVHLMYQYQDCAEYHLDDELRQLSFYSMSDEGIVNVHSK